MLKKLMAMWPHFSKLLNDHDPQYRLRAWKLFKLKENLRKSPDDPNINRAAKVAVADLCDVLDHPRDMPARIPPR